VHPPRDPRIDLWEFVNRLSHDITSEGQSPIFQIFLSAVVMALGGWSSYDAIEPYLAAPTEANIIESMSAVEL
jgi:hypothetical protein